MPTNPALYSLIALVWFCISVSASEAITIISPKKPSWAEQVAAREARRYLYLTTGKLLNISERNTLPREGEFIVISRSDREMLKALRVEAELQKLAPQNFLLKTVEANNRRVLVVAGGDDTGTLYGAYRLAEIVGVRFYIHGDVVPDEKVALTLPRLNEVSRPLFALRGIQPFHDFPEGPDWWNRDDYLSIIGQLPKLRMNFFGLHTYPEQHPHAEPTVWIGLPQDVREGGRVAFSYPASYNNTMRDVSPSNHISGNWGYLPRKTSEFSFGSSQLFEHDAYGSVPMLGNCPFPDDPENCNLVFERTAALLREGFEFAHQIGVKTCVGTETPLTIPTQVKDRLKRLGKNPDDMSVRQEIYEGIFQRACAAYPLDYYWFWTPEGWTWSGTKEEDIIRTTNDIFAAISAQKKVAPALSLATCGWVLGPQQDRSMFGNILPNDVAVSCINRQVGNTPVDAGFAKVFGRSKWAIPWVEDDPGLSAPQLWAGRMRRDAYDALRYGCDGLLGIHWRTRILSPNFSALAQAAWTQEPWAPATEPAPEPPKTEGAIGGKYAVYNNPIEGTTNDFLYQSVRWDVSGYHLPVSNGVYQVTFKFCEVAHDRPGARVFDVKLQGRKVLDNLDIFARVGKNCGLLYVYTNVVVSDGLLRIDFVPKTEFPSIAALVVEGKGYVKKINCGGPAYQDYVADYPPGESPQQNYMPAQDFYLDWAVREFGKDIGIEAARIFEKLDCHLPRPVDWVGGPGGLKPDSRPWENVVKEYAFADEFALLGAKVKNAGERERFEYWRDNFLYMRTVGQLRCVWGKFNAAMEIVRKEIDPARQKKLAQETALPVRKELIAIVDSVYRLMLATVKTTGELGTVANWDQHILPTVVHKPGEELEKILSQPLPIDACVGKLYHGPTRIIVPAIRSSLKADENMRQKCIVLAECPPRQVQFYWRKLGARTFKPGAIKNEARGVWTAALPADNHDFEYYIKVVPAEGPAIYYPATAPVLNQTVIRLPDYAN